MLHFTAPCERQTLNMTDEFINQKQINKQKTQNKPKPTNQRNNNNNNEKKPKKPRTSGLVCKGTVQTAQTTEFLRILTWCDNVELCSD